MNEPETLDLNSDLDTENRLNPETNTGLSNPESFIYSTEEFEKLMGDPYARLTVFINPDSYSEYISKEALIKLAINEGDYSLSYIAEIIDQYTDGSNKELITKIVELKYGRGVTEKFTVLENLDREWYINLVKENNDLKSMVLLLPYTDKIDQKELFEKIVSDQRIVSNDAVNGKLDLFSNLDKDAVLQELLDNNRFQIVASNMKNYFNNFSEEYIYKKIIGSDVGKNQIGDLIDYFDNLDIHRDFLFSAIARQDRSSLIAAISYERLKKELISKKDLIKLLCQSGLEDVVIETIGTDQTLSFYTFEDLPSLEELESMDAHGLIIANVSNNPEYSSKIDIEEKIKQLLENDSVFAIEALIKNNHIHNISSDLANCLLLKGNFDLIANKSGAIDDSFFTQEVVEKFLQADEMSYEIVYKRFKAHTNQTINYIEKSYSIFGDKVNPTVIYAVKEILADGTPLPEHYMEIGISEKGLKGIDQLKEVIKVYIRANLLRVNPNIEEHSNFIILIRDNPLARAIAQQQVRFKGSEYGEDDLDAWKNILNKHLSRLHEIPKLPESFTESQVYDISSVDFAEYDSNKIDEDAKNRYLALREIIEQAIALNQIPAGERYEALFSEARKLLNDELGQLTLQLEQQAGNEKAVINLTKQIEKLDTILNLSARDLMKLIYEGGLQNISNDRVKGFNDLVLIGTIARCIQLSDYLQTSCQELKDADVSYENIIKLNTVIENLVNDHTTSRYFPSDSKGKNKKFFVSLASTISFKKLIEKHSKESPTGTSKLQMVPSNGLMLELSGHTADTCWASVYDSIGEQFPNITDITFVRNPGESTERVVGACLLIKTTDPATNEELYIIRGVNPIENYINGVKVEDFVNSLFDYVNQIANGKKVAIVIDSKSGSAATNREALLLYLNSIKGSQTHGNPIGNLGLDTKFNNYDLNKITYYLNK